MKRAHARLVLAAPFSYKSVAATPSAINPFHEMDQMNTLEGRRLTVGIYQLTDDQFFKSRRTDGSGWDWSWAEYQRDWMDATPIRHAYRCLPLTIVNQTGWWIKNPVGFTATWNGSMAAGNIAFQFDSPDPYWKQIINSQFGEGIITWNTPFLFRTEPVGSRLLVMGPANYFRENAHPLTALIESDWMTMSFTMNYKLMAPNKAVRFEVGEPLFQVIPLISNVCTDLEAAEVRYLRLNEDPEMYKAYDEWSTGRTKFHEAKARNEIKAELWQKDYFQGRDTLGREVVTDHKTKVKPPRIIVTPGAIAEASLGMPAAAPKAKATAPVAAIAPEPAEPMHEDSIGSRRRPLSRRRRPEPRVRSLTNGHGEADETAVSAGTNGHANGSVASPGTNDSGLAGCPMNHGNLMEQILASRPSSAEATVSGQGDEPARAEQSGAMQDYSQASDAATPANGTTATLESHAATARQETTAATPKVDDDWRRWIAHNLMLESSPEDVYAAMCQAGIAPQEAEKEVRQALESPYFRGADQLRNRMKKRDWLLETYRKINRLSPESDIIPRRHRLTRGQFLDEYYSTNRPVIITGMMDDWPAMKKWNLDYFKDKFADRDIEVQFGRNSSDKYEVESRKFLKTIKMGEFVEMVRSATNTNDFYLTANNNSNNKLALPELWEDIVQIPEYLSQSDPMSGFFWMGPIGTVTPFHHDLTNNFMAQVMGRKRVLIAPSWDMPLMKNDFHVFSRVDGRVTPPDPKPARFDQPQVVECILNPGEILFLPIGCLHYVEGIEISVTVSFINFVFHNDFSSNYTTYHQV